MTERPDTDKVVLHWIQQEGLDLTRLDLPPLGGGPATEYASPQEAFEAFCFGYLKELYWKQEGARRIAGCLGPDEDHKKVLLKQEIKTISESAHAFVKVMGDMRHDLGAFYLDVSFLLGAAEEAGYGL